MDDVIQVGGRLYVPTTSSRLDDRTRILKHGDSFAVFDRYGDIHSIGHGEQGIYFKDTRFVSRLDLRLADGRRPVFLNSTVKDDNNLLTVDLTVPEIRKGERLLVPLDTIHIFRAKLLYHGVCYEPLRLTNYGTTAVDIPFVFKFETDFADIFEVRGATRAAKGRRLEPSVSGQTVVIAYQGLDGVLRQTSIELENTDAEIKEDEIRFAVALTPGASKDVYLTIGCQLNEEMQLESNYWETFKAVSHELEEARQLDSAVHTSNEQFNDWLNRSAADLHLLTSETGMGLYPYAGVPWFNTVFGRDGIITALQYLWVSPNLARGVLAYLAANQATEVDPAREAEPGKILHETRRGEMATLGEVPFARYYGSVDATPLFIVLAGAYYERTGDRAFIESIWPNIEKALTWIEDYGDVDSDGFIEYLSHNERGLSQQGWKDSDDSVFHDDGTAAQGAIALCEVQGYVYDAWIRAATLCRVLGKAQAAERLLQQASALKQHFNEAFWCEDIATYALALDGEKRPCRVRSSNAGHTLFSGIATPEYARRVAATLLSDSAYSGWGIRTISEGEARYNPMSYHNGAVWPHDNALIALGLARYGFHQETTRIVTGLFDGSLFLDLSRMPELFCGFVRRPGEGPTLYPVACAPQAWASTAVFSFVQACLGLSLTNTSRPRLDFNKPQLPPFLNSVELKNLRAGDASVDIQVHRHED
ncbi:MAG: amylo-alpha-1,6-glucosidase, partial [Halobacteria archaeon]|nr:amylo-alpha-1,6-glucosidase [Halobacteria archaeon]